MQNQEKTTIKVETTINAPVEIVWSYWTSPEHICAWNNASPEWHTPKAENDLQVGGKFCYRMEAKDGSVGFDFEGVYDVVELNKKLAFTLGDGRKAEVIFEEEEEVSKVVEIFESEGTNSIEKQQAGWQAILDNFKKYVEAN